LARRLATALGGVYLRADTIEGALREAGLQDIGGTGYMVGYALARENLLMGRCVVADSVNPWALTREAWRESARPAGVPFLDVEVV
ncbi:adenylyl-sulfate kinase, partial [Acinetobacter baumannii]